MVVDTTVVRISQVSPALFRVALGSARWVSDLVAGATSKPEEMPDRATYYLSTDLESGFGVDSDGTLIGVFSLKRGRGDFLVQHAVLFGGANRLDCFDGYLPELYARHGFVETHRVANWRSGDPDVVFMRLVSK